MSEPGQRGVVEHQQHAEMMAPQETTPNAWPAVAAPPSTCVVVDAQALVTEANTASSLPAERFELLKPAAFQQAAGEGVLNEPEGLLPSGLHAPSAVPPPALPPASASAPGGGGSSSQAPGSRASVPKATHSAAKGSRGGGGGGGGAHKAKSAAAGVGSGSRQSVARDRQVAIMRQLALMPPTDSPYASTICSNPMLLQLQQSAPGFGFGGAVFLAPSAVAAQTAAALPPGYQ